MPGRITIRPPAKPASAAIHCFALVRSLRISTASTEATIGIMKVMAATSATGASDSAPNRHHMFSVDIMPRTACMPRWLVRMAPGPTRISQGSMNISPNTLRPSATSKIGSVWVR